MAYGFSCLKCGQALTQDTVVFDLLNNDSKRGTNELTLCLTEKELRHIWRKSGKAGRYIVDLPWRNFLRYVGNEKNLGIDLLQKLQYSSRSEELKDQCRILGLNDNFVMRGLERAFSIHSTEDKKKAQAPHFYREVEPVYCDGILTSLRIFGNGCSKGGDVVSRRCCRRECGSAQPDWAGRFEHRSVVLLGMKENEASPKKICEEVVDYLLQYQHKSETPLGGWIAYPVDKNENQIDSTTIRIRCDGVWRYLTFAAVPCRNGAYLVEEHFFQEADAYVLCDQVDAPDIKDRQKNESDMLQCLKTLQNQRTERLELTEGHSGHAPVLLLFSSNKENVEPERDNEGNIVKLGDFFEKKWRMRKNPTSVRSCAGIWSCTE